MLPGTGLSGTHSLGLMKRSNIKTRPFADKTVTALKPEEKAYRERDSNGLYLHVRPDGRKGWEPRYRKHDGKYSWLGMEAYPDIRPKEARVKAQEARALLAQGITPRQHQNSISSRNNECVACDEGQGAYVFHAKKPWLSTSHHVIPTMAQQHNMRSLVNKATAVPT